MYQDFFSLNKQPFSISPDPDFLFLSDRHKEALAHLTYGLQDNGGFVLLTGEVGTGKTTVCRALLQNIAATTDIAFVLNPALSEMELLATICDEFNIEYEMTLKSLFDALKSWMMNNLGVGRSAIVLIDEAQHLSFSALEQLRLLTNIESDNKKPLQVILIGQTELQQRLKQTELRQLAQRITARYHLLPLTQTESEYYIQHRLNIAGASFPIFERRALAQIFTSCQGVPRLINLLCDRSLLSAYTQNRQRISAKMVRKAQDEIALSGSVNALAKRLKNSWRVVLVLVLGLYSAFQAAPLVAQFFQTKAPIEQKIETSLKPQIELQTELLKAERSKEMDWFNAYPELQLSNATFANALVNLYALWGYQTELKSVNCEQGAAALLSCYSQNSSLKKLKKLNYPSVVKLERETQDTVYAIIYKIADNYQLLIDGQVIDVSETWFNRYWTGDFTLLWQAPFAMQAALQFGQQNGNVAWLATQLNTIQGLPAQNKNRFDLALLQQVGAFQRDQGLKDDGIVGVRTLMPLMQLSHPEFPRLSEKDH